LCFHCDLDDAAVVPPQPHYDRRSFLRRAVTGAGLVVAGGLALPEHVLAAPPPFESLGLGEERLPLSVRLAPQAPARPAAAPVAKAPVSRGVAPPKIVSRRQWGANERLRSPQRAYAPVRKFVVHHSASANNPRDPVAVLHLMYEWQVRQRGFADFGYNFAIDHRGTIYEGRWAREYGAGETPSGEDADGHGVLAAHAKGVNAGTCGIVLIGDFTKGQPTNAMIASLVHLMAWKAARHRIDGLRTDPYRTLFGDPREFPNISPHALVGRTICPGAVTRQLPWIRQEVARRAGRYPAASVNLARTIRYRGGMPPIQPGPATTAAAATTTTRPAATTTTTAKPVTPTGAFAAYRVLDSDGRIITVGAARPGPSPRAHGRADSASMAAARSGYWVLDKRGGVLAFNGARWFGSPARLGKPVRVQAITGRPQLDGYWVLTVDGTVLPFGAARHFGSPSADRVPAMSVAIRSTPTGAGYWVLTGDGRLRSYGDATRFQSGALRGPVDFWPTPSGRGAWILTGDGVVGRIGDAANVGDMRSRKGSWARPGVSIVGAPDGKGYTLLDNVGRLYSFGSAPSYGNAPGIKRAIGLVAVPRA
jgi:hypothetical protein